MGAIKYTVHDDFDHIVDEKGNSFLALRKITWGDNEDPNKAKLDLRKWFINAEGEEVVGKGVSFLTENGPNVLTKVLVDNGYGDTRDVLEGLKPREDFKQSLNIVMGKDSEHYDPSVKDEIVYVPGSELYDY